MNKSNSEKELNNINLAIVGHIDNGKSTLSGQLLHQQGFVSGHQIDKYKKASEQVGKKTFEFAWVMDKLQEQRKRGVTIHISHREFKTKDRNFTIVDCPGHSDYIKNFITGVSQADSAILLMDVQKGIQEQTKQHIRLVWNARIKNIIVAINKMDVIDYSEQKFQTRKNQIQNILKKLGYKQDNCFIIPISALLNQNVVKKSDKMPWYTSPCLVEILNSLPLPILPVDKPFRLQVTDVLTKTGIGVIVTGKVISGIIKSGDKVIVKPGSKSGEVKSIEMHHKPYVQAYPGFNVGIVIRGLSKEFVRKGFIIAHPDSAPKTIIGLKAKVSIIHPEAKIRKLSDVLIHYGTGVVAAKVSEIYDIYDRNNKSVFDKKDPNTQIVKRGYLADIELLPDRPIVMQTIDNSQELGRFPIRTELGTIAFGVCTEIRPHKEESESV
jgi:elongation factor 1-alpha